ncbi:MAG: DUF4424 domain-containing protein [Devosia sp.]|nr:DUF4424 domain-containing protein [Devosia sp.]
MRPLHLLAVLLPVVGPAAANDTMSQLGTGGLIFLTSEHVSMQSEDLFVSPEQVRVRYEFVNNSDADETALVSFPLPDIQGSGDFMVSVPGEDPDNIFGFTTTFDGKPVELTLHQYAFAFGVDQTDLLVELGVPLIPFGTATTEALNALAEADQRHLLHLGLVIPMQYDSGGGWQTDYVPVWTLKSAYTWEATFRAGEIAEVEHSYVPSVGGTVAVTFLSPPYDGYDPATDYLKRYCTDDGFVNAVRKTLPNPEEPYGAPFTESWISYIWSTGANWSGAIGRFHLTIDKGRPENLVSFCWDGKVTKTSPTTFEMEATDWFPPYNRELEVLILNRNEGSAG